MERLFDAGFFWSMTIVTGMFSIFPTLGRPYLGRYCCTKLGKVSLSSRRLSAAMVSRQSDDFPEPDTPVNTVILCLGMSTEMFFRLFSVAPVIEMQLVLCIVVSCNFSLPKIEYFLL